MNIFFFSCLEVVELVNKGRVSGAFQFGSFPGDYCSQLQRYQVCFSVQASTIKAVESATFFFILYT